MVDDRCRGRDHRTMARAVLAHIAASNGRAVVVARADAPPPVERAQLSCARPSGTPSDVVRRTARTRSGCVTLNAMTPFCGVAVGIATEPLSVSNTMSTG